MKFTHLSQTKLTKFKTPKSLGKSFKPKGCLWFACKDTWESWLSENEQTDWLEKYKYKYKANLDTKSLIVLRTKKEIGEFTEQYKIDKYTIDWNRVREDTGKYEIYIVNPSIKSARQEYAWYSSFDVCSVGVWDERAILSLEETTSPPS